MDNLSLIENGMTFKDIEEKIYKTVCDVACGILKEVLEHLDRRLMEERDTKALRNKGVKHTCIKTIMGNVEFNRRIYEFKMEDGKSAYKFLLDESLQMSTIGHYSSNLIDKVIHNISDLSFRKTAENVEKSSNQSISHTAVWNIVQTIGNTIEKQDKKKIDRYNKNDLHGTKETKVIFQEMDGLWLSMQGKDSSGSVKSSTFKVLGKACLVETYNVDEIQARIINGDGVSWIRKSADIEGVYYQLDPFHRSQAIIRAIRNKSEANKLIKLFNEGKATEGMEYIKELLIKYDKDKKSFDKLCTLFNYFAKNKSGLIPYNLRKDIELPNPPEGIEYRTLGTMEHNICDVLAKRLKGGKRSWSKIGANNIAKILSSKANNKIRSVISSDFNDLMEKFEDIVVLHPEAVDKEFKKCKSYTNRRAPMPYDGYAITEGRNVIRNLVRNRTMSNLGY